MNITALIIYYLLLIGAVYMVSDRTDSKLIAMLAVIVIYMLGYWRGICV